MVTPRSGGTTPWTGGPCSALRLVSLSSSSDLRLYSAPSPPVFCGLGRLASLSTRCEQPRFLSSDPLDFFFVSCYLIFSVDSTPAAPTPASLSGHRKPPLCNIFKVLRFLVQFLLYIEFSVIWFYRATRMYILIYGWEFRVLPSFQVVFKVLRLWCPLSYSCVQSF